MDADDFVAFSRREEVALPAGGAPQDALRGFLTAYAAALRVGGCSMVGHIKGMLEDGESPPLFFSLTSLEGEPRLKCGSLKPRPRLALSINVIVAGIAAGEAAALLQASLARHFRSSRAERG